MDLEFLKKVINDQFESTPDYVVAVGWGIKYVNNQPTDEVCLTYDVLEKKPIELIPESELIPKTIIISGVTFKTDVKASIIKPIQSSTFCNPYTYDFWSNAPINRNYTRPLKGGISSNNFTKFYGYTCTLGFLAVDNDTGSLLGVSNNHCLVNDAFYCSLRNQFGFRENEVSSIVVQPAEGSYSTVHDIGVVKKYVPLTGGSSPIIYNRVDGACTTVNEVDIDFNESWKFVGFTGYSQPMSFATTSEINSLTGLTAFTTSPNLYSAGRTTGAKGEKGNCRLQLDAFPVTIQVPFNKQNVDIPAYFEDQIRFRLTCPDYSIISNYCRYPVQGGDSGSALIYETPSGERKILGLVFACSQEPGTDDCYMGYANRIDHVASELNISAWTGQTVGFSNLLGLDAVCLPNTTDKTIVIAGKTYWQLGFCLP